MRGRLRRKINSIYREIRDLSRDEGSPDDLEFMGRGSSRIVYRIKSARFGSEHQGRVIKFAMNQNGKLDNKLESSTWESVRSSELSNFFCPVREVDTENYNWLIMDYARDVNGSKAVPGFKRTLIDELGYSPDLQNENLGILDSQRIVVRDYSWSREIDIVQ